MTTSLIVNPSSFQIVNTAICQGDSLNIGGSYISETGTYYNTISTSTGCDSVQQINLLVHQVFETTNYVSICEGTQYLFGELLLTSTGSYSDTMQTVTGCDSIVNTILTVHPNKDNLVNTSICEGDSIFLGGNFVSTSGFYYDTLSTSFGCDSVVVTKLKLIALPNASFQVNSINQNEFNFINLSTSSNSYVWNFDDNQTSYENSPYHQYTSSGEFEVMLIATSNCGSDTTVNLVTSLVEVDFYNVFSPNDDGKNDYWNIPILNYFADNKVTIINRWGNEVGSINQPAQYFDDRRGHWNPSEVDNGVYFYTALGKGFDGQIIKRNGSFQVLK